MTDEGASPVEVTRHGHVLVVEMRRADKRNAIDRAMADALDRALTLLDEDGDLWVGVLAADGPVFSAGSDLTAGGDYVTERGGEYGVIRRHRTKPLIAAVDGPALGGGFEIVLACDLVVASDAAVFGLPEVAIGLVPTCAGLFRAPRSLPLNLARELALTGDPISSSRAYAAGFANVLTPAGEARSAAVQLAERICKNAPVAVRASLRAVNEMAAAHDGAGWEATDAAKRAIAGSLDAAEGVRAFLEKRSPEWTGR
ncbi:enoyl-CoA hydratase-related protein [Rhodococcus chondri]|uniref:Enoyl-CoA hydratase-related protein n=1 Tax=Rhodococcus chondri TaxID=3065941 RepID=A0ABU7JMN1_9NOCA|nr:enoyl-CoA hydratase-related protein [Rhodococcus sp. CC-R104]MEE2031290.1 enoyl-CoA hydratase-related protein [Rhodococcus sp. CC-R104]